MSLRPPSNLAKPSLQDPLSAALEHEVMAEKASTLGRLMMRLEKTLARLDRIGPDDHGEAALLDAAGEALWYVIIQRDLCGLRNHAALMRDMNVPAAVRLRMGVAPRRSPARE